MTKFLHVSDVHININRIVYFEDYGNQTKIAVEGNMVKYVSKEPKYVAEAIEELSASRNTVLDFYKWYEEKYSNK